MTLIFPKTPKKYDGHRMINDAIQEMRKDFRIMSDKKRHTIWIDDNIWQELLCLYKRDNCSTQNEFVENALRFYIGYLNTKNAGAFLPEALSAMLQGSLDHYTQRIGSVLFKQGVDINVMSQIIAYDTDIDEGTYQRLRGRAVRDMQRTNGRVSFKDALDFQKTV